MSSGSINSHTSPNEAAITTALKAMFRAWAVVGRTSCPPVELLHGYAKGALTTDQRDHLERHFLHCDPCLEAAAAPLADDAEELPACAPTPPRASDLVVRCRTGLFEVLSTTLSLSWLSQASPVRGHVVPRGAHFQCYKATGPVVTLLDISPSETGAANLQVRLQEGAPVNQPPFEVRLFADGREIASASISKEPVLFEGLIPAKWMVRIYQSGTVLGETQIELRE